MTDLPTSLPCSTATLRQSHPPHGWEPQPGMNPVHCPGHGRPEPVTALPWTQLEARAFNAVLPALRGAGEWLPLSARRAVARAVLAELQPELGRLDRYRAWLADQVDKAERADQVTEERGGVRDELRISPHNGLAAGLRTALLALDQRLETSDASQTDDTELTAEEARALADDLGLQLYEAQDAVAFVAECCTIAEREQRAITTADVREWLKGARCGRQLAASGPPCSCGGRFPLAHLHADQHQPEEQP
ncbi:hypothetical protein AB0F09_19135 [Streptomyces olivaceus]|uniref:hypothetical protein n=1 Tax=Streptomyces olivaceus TaxID=47716 RepID=UPI0033E4DA90